MKSIIILCVVALAAADHGKKFKEWNQKHGKIYKNAVEEAKALKNHLENDEMIGRHRALLAAGKSTFEIDHNEYSDQNLDELRLTLGGTKSEHSPRALPQAALPTPASFPAGPPTKSWISYVQPVVNQKTCASCWAFAAVAQIESLYLRQGKNYVLSQQYLVSCAKNGINAGCKGGWSRLALEFAQPTGLPLNSTYPYISANGTCVAMTAVLPKPIYTQSIQYSLAGNEVYLKNILAQDGPVVVSIYMTNLFQLYKSGIFQDTIPTGGCSIHNHSVLLVGYGSEVINGISYDYWLIKNSHGTTWGINGYMKVIRNAGNNINIGCFAIYGK